MGQPVGGQGDPMLLFVCTGNVCRSPFAERYAISAQRSFCVPWRFAGVGALAGAPMDEPMAAELRARGGDLSGFAAQQLADVLAARCSPSVSPVS